MQSFFYIYTYTLFFFNQTKCYCLRFLVKGSVVKNETSGLGLTMKWKNRNEIPKDTKHFHTFFFLNIFENLAPEFLFF